MREMTREMQRAVEGGDLIKIHEIVTRSNVNDVRKIQKDSALAAAVYAVLFMDSPVDIVRYLWALGGAWIAKDFDSTIYYRCETDVEFRGENMWSWTLIGNSIAKRQDLTNNIMLKHTSVRELQEFLAWIRESKEPDLGVLKDKELLRLKKKYKLDGEGKDGEKPEGPPERRKDSASYNDVASVLANFAGSKAPTKQKLTKPDGTNISYNNNVLNEIGSGITEVLEEKEQAPAPSGKEEGPAGQLEEGELQEEARSAPATLAERVTAMVQSSGLENVIGLKKVKKMVADMARDVLLEQIRRDAGVGKMVKEEMLHMAFLGNPGTGKTSIARLLAKVLHAAGKLKRGVVVEVQREDLVGEHIGETEKITNQVIASAKGGILFVDEAYRLWSESSKDYGLKALETLMAVMTKGDPMIVLAGYNDEMQKLLVANPGLKRRITHYFQFDDYTPDEIAQMFNMRVEFLDYHVDPEAAASLGGLIHRQISSERLKILNAGLIDQLFLRARQSLNRRLLGTETPKELVTFNEADLLDGLREIRRNLSVVAPRNGGAGGAPPAAGKDKKKAEEAEKDKD